MTPRSTAGAVDRGAPALGKTRGRVLRALQGTTDPLTVEDVAEALGLHPNTARFHLDALVSSGLAQRTSEQRETPGRPRTLYRTTNDGVRTGRRSYGLLAEILTRYLATHVRRPTREALRAGEEWGRLLTANAGDTRDAAAATRHLVRTLDEIGFAPEAVRVGGERQIQLHHCPFWEAAEQNREVVCAVHLGLMRGVFAELDAPIDANRLDPWVGPSLCVTHLGPRDRTADDPPTG